MPIIPLDRDYEGGAEEVRAKRNALARLSKRCPVIRQANIALDGIEDGKCFDAEYAIDMIIASLRGMPEATATIDLMDRILKLTK